MPHAVILTAHPDEFHAVRAHLTDHREEIHSEGTIYEVGDFSANGQRWEVAIAEIENSNVSAATETERAISHFKPAVIALVTSATGIKDVSPRDVVVASKLYGYEAGKEGKVFEPRPKVHQPSYRLKQRAKAELKKTDWLTRLLPESPGTSPNVFLSPVASGDKEVTARNTNLWEFLRTQYGDAVATESLGYGFLESAYANRDVIQALTVYEISCLAGDSETPDSSVKTTAIKHASAFMFEILAKFRIDDTNTTQRLQGTVVYGITPDELFTGITQQPETVTNGVNRLNEEHHKRINYIEILLNKGQFFQAIQDLESIRNEVRYQADNAIKYRFYINLGRAKLGLGEINKATENLLEALQYNPSDDGALAYAAMAYVFQGDYNKAKSFIDKALEKNPANTLAYSQRIRMVPMTESIETVLEQIPQAYRENPDILVALGEAALNRGLDDRATEWLQSALANSVGGNMDRVKAFLGFVLIKPLSQNYPLFAVGQLQDYQRQSLEQAVALFSEVLGNGTYINPKELSPLQFKSLCNRATTLRLLRLYDDAIRDIEMALQKEPQDAQLIKQRALLAYEKGNEKEAYEYLQKILQSPDTPETSLLAASYLIQHNHSEEAENLLNQFLQAKVHSDLKQEAKRLLFDLYLKQNNSDNAERILQTLKSEDNDSLYTLIREIQWQKYIDTDADILGLIEKAKAAIPTTQSTPAQLFLANVLFEFQYYRDAAEVYEQFVDKGLNTPLSRKLLYAYHFSGNHQDALNLCQLLLKKYGPLPIFAEMAAYVYGEIVCDLVSVQKICEDYLRDFPNSTEMKLRLAAANHASGNLKQLDYFLDSAPNIDDLDLNCHRKLAHLYKVRNRTDQFLETIYETRRRFYNDAQVHAYYQISFLEATKINEDFPLYDEIEDGCGVLVTDHFSQQYWYILEDKPESTLSRNELTSEDSLYKELMGKKVGDRITIHESSLSSNSLEIQDIASKYLAASRQSLIFLSSQPNVKDFQAFSIPMDGDRISDAWMTNLIADIQKNQDEFKKIKDQYISGVIPLGAVAKIINRNIIETWYYLAFGIHPFIHVWSNFQNEKFENSVACLHKGRMVVIGPVAILTIHHLHIANDVVDVLGKLGIAQSTVDLFQSMVESEQGLRSQGFSTIRAEAGKGVIEDFSAEQVKQRVKLLEDILVWIRKNCEVLPCYKALEISSDMYNQLQEIFGAAFTDTALIAGEPGRILYSDDQCLRRYAFVDSRVPGIWTQVVLKYCFVKQNFNAPRYHKATLTLVALGYTHNYLEAGTLIESLRLAEWEPNLVYTAALKALTHENLNLRYSISIAVEFLYQLSLEVIVTDSQWTGPRDAIIFELLKVLTDKRSVNSIIQALKRSIRRRFEIIPLQEREILQAIDAWQASQLIIT